MSSTREAMAASPPSPPASPRIRRRRWLLIGALAIVVLVLAEVGARVLQSRLPAPLVWHSYEAQKKVQQMDALRTQGGAPVVFLGTSEVNVGIQPAVFTAAAGGGLVAYNAALSSSIPRLDVPWTMNVVVPRLHPKLIVVGVSSYDFDANPPARTAFYDAFLASPAARLAMGRASAMDKVNHWLSQHSALWANRAELRDPETLFKAVIGDAPPVETEVKLLEPDGHANIVGYPEDLGLRNEVEIADWQAGTADPDAIVTLIRDARQIGSQVVLVDMPVTQHYVDDDPRGEADMRTYLSLLDGLGRQMNVPVLHFDTMRNLKYFTDEVHLNDYGSRVFTAQLARDLAADHVLDGVRSGSR